jgi:hypothetical protein
VEPLRYTLVGDGSSDRCLLPINDLLLSQDPIVSERGFVPQWADLRRSLPPPRDLSERIHRARREWPCELMFVHRDAESGTNVPRLTEIRAAFLDDGLAQIPVVPVRMMETWLLIDERAIRLAADNPNGASTIPLPELRRLEDEAEPKELLLRCLVLASEKSGRRLDQFRRTLYRRVHRVADLIEDFSPLRRLPAFQQFEASAREALASLS